MVTVMATGVFDILHMGHIHFLTEAKKLGDKLVVVVAHDETVRHVKYEPVTPGELRLEMIKSLKPVDEAYLGSEGDIYSIVEEIKPDIIAIGYDQPHDPDKIRSDLKQRGLDIEVIRLPKLQMDLDGTRKIIRKIIAMYNFQRQMEAVEGKFKGV